MESKASRGPIKPEDPEQESEITNAINDKRFLGRVSGAFTVVPEAHQEVGGHAHQLPEHINFQKVGTDHKPQHGAAEDRQIGKEAHIALVVGHVAVGINHHQQRHRCHQGEHHSCKWVDDVPHRKDEVSSTCPDEQVFNGGGSTQLFEQNGVTNDRCSSNAADQQ